MQKVNLRLCQTISQERVSFEISPEFEGTSEAAFATKLSSTLRGLPNAFEAFAYCWNLYAPTLSAFADYPTIIAQRKGLNGLVLISTKNHRYAQVAQFIWI